MPTIWTNDLSTGIDVIDSQHMRIVEYINQLENAVTQQDSRTIGLILDELVDYTLSHFAFEESLQEAAGYELAKPHKAVHDSFAKRVATYQARHNAGENVAEQLHGMLRTWLVHHIKRDDLAYVSKVRANITDKITEKREGSWLSRSLGKFFK